ncbi:DUF2913 family protein [Motilimonas cestriensis]|uniref:DUF2913 family protein n=1 Tax=Motilimonas cestriensis TaxID=2742685 RepID=A0ABS8W8K5_9GAMM|nr:DUF2913 family protein [Motilimonas cestriensis]MCE2595329.1 DUF2913 family protein [Motilimonas cestriensis]
MSSQASSTFAKEIYDLACIALNELEQAHLDGSVSRTPVNQAHYLNAWVTKAIKTQRFAHCVAATLLVWQQQGRSMGKHAQLKQTFEDITRVYGALLSEQGTLAKVYETQIDALFDQLAESDWSLITDSVIERKVKRNSAGMDSLVVCRQQYERAIHAEEKRLIRPLSCYVRGNVQQLISLAGAQNLLLFKVTDYKSKVKYHGEYVIYPSNNGPYLAEFLAK